MQSGADTGFCKGRAINRLPPHHVYNAHASPRGTRKCNLINNVSSKLAGISSLSSLLAILTRSNMHRVGQ